MTLGFRLTDFPLYRQAFIHKSCASGEEQSYERLEFIGDAVINLIVARWLFEAWPREQEGFLTRLRTRLVNSKTLSKLAQELQLDRFIMMSERALQNGWQHNPRILEDTFEALIGAIYLSEGLVVARQFLITLYQMYIDFTQLMKEENYKDQLMRFCQANGWPLPEYEVLATHQHHPKSVFEVVVKVQQDATGTGRGHTKKAAQQEAAKSALRTLGVPPNY